MIESLTYEDVAEDYPRAFQSGRPQCGMGVGRGWEALIREVLQGIEDLLPEKHDFKVSQIKEKFGGLRFYAFSLELPEETKKKIDKLISLAESRSFGVCEMCGEPARADTGGSRFGWIKSLCDAHKQERSRGYGPDNTRRPVPTDDIELK